MWMIDMKKTALTIAAAAGAVGGLYAFSVRGRTGHPGLADLRGWSYAHRGLHGEGAPENSMTAFRAALENGYGIELDVHLLADGTLAVIHDHSLLRTAGVDVQVESLTAETLGQYSLQGTGEPIPLFSQVLELFAGKAPMIVELKATMDNYAALCEAACDMLAGYEGVYCVESFDPRCVGWLKKHRPQVIRGQLTENSIPAKGKFPLPLRFALTHQMENFLTTPDFVAYRYCDRKTLGNFLVRKLWGVEGVSWTLRTPEEYAQAVEEGWIPIFEGFRP